MNHIVRIVAAVCLCLCLRVDMTAAAAATPRYTMTFSGTYKNNSWGADGLTTSISNETSYGLKTGSSAGRKEYMSLTLEGSSTAGSATLGAGGKTVVVSGCGADVVYPRSSRDVFEGAVATGGAVVSAEPWGQGPRRWAFPKRNALIAALSRVLLVTEAGLRSGTMSTAAAAADLDRIVYAIPGSIFSPNSSGTNRLIGEGARIVSDEHELSVAIALDYGFARVCPGGSRGRVGPVLSALVASPARPDELALRLNENVLTVLKTLAEHEARGVVERLPDGRYSPTKAFLMGHNE